MQAIGMCGIGARYWSKQSRLNDPRHQLKIRFSARVSLQLHYHHPKDSLRYVRLLCPNVDHDRLRLFCSFVTCIQHHFVHITLAAAMLTVLPGKADKADAGRMHVLNATCTGETDDDPSYGKHTSGAATEFTSQGRCAHMPHR